MTNWLKVIGASWHPIQDTWTIEGRFLLDTATFTGRCTWEPGDQFLYHALGNNESRVVAAGEVLSTCRRDPTIDPFDFDFVCDVKVTSRRDHISEGIRLEEFNVPGERDLRRSIQRHSHIRLSDGEFKRAKRALAD
jgi:hypothetical protein